MSPQHPLLVPAVPPGGVLLHVGPHKTGTTAVQSAAASMRRELAANGVFYPGRTHNHTVAAMGALGSLSGWYARRGYVPDPARWTALVDEVRAAERRALVSSEVLCEASPATMSRIVGDFSDRPLRVVVTLRSMARILPSAWVQGLRGGSATTYEEWLHKRLVDEPRAEPDAPFDQLSRFWVRNDHAALVRRWAAAVGPDRLTVVVLENEGADFLMHAFESLLDLPQGLLRQPRATRDNRSLTAGEAETLRLVNRALEDTDVSWREYEALVRLGTARRMAEQRQPAPEEPRTRTPQWALDVAAELDGATADAIEELGISTVGATVALRGATRALARDEESATTRGGVAWLPADAAAEAVLGSISGALTGTPTFGGSRRTTVPRPRDARPVPAGSGHRPVREVPASDLVTELVRRARRRARRSLGRAS